MLLSDQRRSANRKTHGRLKPVMTVGTLEENQRLKNGELPRKKSWQRRLSCEGCLQIDLVRSDRSEIKVKSVSIEVWIKRTLNSACVGGR